MAARWTAPPAPPRRGPTSPQARSHRRSVGRPSCVRRGLPCGAERPSREPAVSAAGGSLKKTGRRPPEVECSDASPASRSCGRRSAAFALAVQASRQQAALSCSSQERRDALMQRGSKVQDPPRRYHGQPRCRAGTGVSFPSRDPALIAVLVGLVLLYCPLSPGMAGKPPFPFSPHPCWLYAALYSAPAGGRLPTVI